MATKAERETIINFAESDEDASIYTCNRKLQNRLEGYGFEPSETDPAVNGRTYSIPKVYVRVQQPASVNRVWTDEQKDAARERLAGVRATRAEARAAAAKAAGTPAPAPKPAAVVAQPAAKPMTAAERLKAKTAAKQAAPAAAAVEAASEVEVVAPKTAKKK